MRAAILLAIVLVCCAGCGGARPTDRLAGDGRTLIAAYGCGACHAIPGVGGADGRVGPSLAGLSDRKSIAGRLANTPENLARWIRRPQAVDPGNLMPDLGVGSYEAAAIAAYLERH